MPRPFKLSRKRRAAASFVAPHGGRAGRGPALGALRNWPAWALWIVLLGLVALDWSNSSPHQRFAEPPPLALGSGPAADAGHCSLAPKR